MWLPLCLRFPRPQESDGSGGGHCSPRGDAAPGIGKGDDALFSRSLSLRERILWSLFTFLLLQFLACKRVFILFSFLY